MKFFLPFLSWRVGATTGFPSLEDSSTLTSLTNTIFEVEAQLEDKEAILSNHKPDLSLECF